MDQISDGQPSPRSPSGRRVMILLPDAGVAVLFVDKKSVIFCLISGRQPEAG
jgi:hypothetical protein